MRRLAVLWVCWLVACAPAAVETGQLEQPILGGTADTTTLDVFLLALTYDNGSTGFCTGTLISPRTLLTAAHCADPAEKGATSLTIQATNKPTSTGLMPSDVIDVSDRRVDPSWSASSRPQGSDVALLLLSRAPTGVTPRAIERSFTTALVGQTVRAVGYGRTQAAVDDSGTRHQVSLPIASMDSNSFELGTGGTTGTCFGDSGGPTLWSTAGQEHLVGIHSFGTTSDCGAGVDTRVDQHVAMIDAWLAEKEPATCAQDGRCAAGCTPDDPDCTVDGQSCASASQCAGSRCVTDGVNAGAYCSRTCTIDADCRSGMSCRTGQCTLIGRPMAGEGQACVQGETQCEAGTLCAGKEGAATTCRVACQESDAGDGCPAQATCVAGQGAVRFCYATQAGLDAGAGTAGVEGHVCATAPGAVAWLSAALLLTTRRRTRRSSRSRSP